MNIETLVSTMGKKYNDSKFLSKDMNLTGNVLVCNQTNSTNVYQYNYKNSTHSIFSYDEIGVGRSRNTLLMRSTADICILSDDDMQFVNNYEDIVRKEFSKRPKADVLIFNLGQRIDSHKTTRDKSINILNYTRYGAARIAFRRKSIINNDIYFSTNFGGGSRFGSGEDTLFLKHCLDKKLKIVAINSTIAELIENRDSTWFEGYNRKYFVDKGALFYSLSPKLFLLNIIQFSIRKYKLAEGNLSFYETIKAMYRGRLEFKNWVM